MAFKKSFVKIKVSGQTDVDADQHTDELTFAAGSNMTITTSGDTVTFASSGGGGGGTSIEDSDGDTKIQVEESSDEDKIRFDTAGSQRMVITDAGKVGIGVDAPGYKLDVDGDVRIRGNDIRDNSGNVAIQMNGSASVAIPNNLSVTGTTALNGVTYTWPSSDGSSGQQLQTNGSGTLSWAAAGSGGGSSESSVSISLTHDNDCFDLGTNAYTAKTTSLTSISIPAGKTVTAVALETTEAFAQNSGTPSGSAVIKIDDVWYKPKFLAESYGYLSESEYWVRNSTTGIYGVVASRQLIGSSAVSPSIQIKQVTNDTSNSGGYLTDGTLKLTIYYT